MVVFIQSLKNSLRHLYLSNFTTLHSMTILIGFSHNLTISSEV